MSTLRNRRELAALRRENCEEHAKINVAQNSTVPRSQEEYITQVSEEVEGRVSKKLHPEISRTKNGILCALSRLDKSFKNPLIQGHSGTAPETSLNAFSTNQGTNGVTVKVILILKQASSTTGRREILAQTTAKR